MKRLRELISSGNAIAFIGAGMSVRAGYLTWTRLLQKLAEDAGKPNLPLTDDPLWNAEEVRGLFEDENSWLNAVQKLFTRGRRKIKDPAILTLVRMPFRHFITTNYDDVIERAHEQVGKPIMPIEWHDEKEVRRFITDLREPRAPRTCLHIHGTYDHPETIVLSETDYSRRYVDSLAAQRKLFAIMATQRMVFFGFSLEDPAFDEILRVARRTLGSGKPRHFAILPIEPAASEKTIRRRLNRKYDIEPIFFEKERYEKFEAIIQKLRKGQEAEPEEIDQDDPNKGQFGGKAERKGWKLSAKIEALPDDPDWFAVHLKMKSKKRALQKGVTFYLHPTFTPQMERVKPDAKGMARYEILAWGAFTVGAEIQDDGTRLELDLATVRSAPLKFKER